MTTHTPHPFPTHYTVRDVLIEPNVVLAPMEGVTDVVFRRMIREIGGAGLTYTEFIASKALGNGDKRALDTARFDPDERPVALQIYGRKPKEMADAARVLEEMGASILDINMGCPSKKVCAHSGGSGLMKDIELAVAIVKAVRAAISIPLTVKMRSGFDAARRNAPELAWRCQEEGAEAITIHWRTREDAYAGHRAVDKIAETVERLSIPVIGNGDIVDVASARAMFEDTGCAGIMVGRGAIRDPWLPRQLSQWLLGEPVEAVGATEKERVLLGYFGKIYTFYGNERRAMGRSKMVTRQFAEDLPVGDGLRFSVLRAQSLDEINGLARRYFDLLRLYEAGDRGPLLTSPFHRAAQEAARRKRQRIDALKGPSRRPSRAPASSPDGDGPRSTPTKARPDR